MKTPLAERVRPKTIDEVAGQKEILGKGKILRNIVESGDSPNLIFYGPSGVGKTTVARIIAENSGKKMCYLNATTASTADIKEIIGEIGTIAADKGILLYLDEIQYFNKKQQQILLSYIENGDITLVASTTENPFFYVYNAILSRSSVFEFKPLSAEEIVPVVKRAAKIACDENGKKIAVDDEKALKIARAAAGDVRRALNILELGLMLAESGKNTEITDDILEQILEGNSVRYDRNGDEHYDIVSAYQKSMRGSDVDASLHYLARLLAAGDLPSACRRLMVCACEDVGLAYPQIIPIVKSAVDIANAVGLPEARIPLADAVILVASAPKSNSGEAAIDRALADVNSGNVGSVPRQLQNKHFDGEGAAVKGQHYLYPHDFKDHYVKQQYLPDNLKNKKYYQPGDNKTEQSFKDYLDKIKK
ncbi:MAG: replication-associated recombination protein A [Clostridia bacterium]|nr:replication-associated recombination protein A [Clostridia bacterium]